MPESHLLLFNLRTDLDDHILGFTTGWINALARHYTSVDVITMHVGRLSVAPNVRVYSMGRERGWPAPRRLWAFYRLLLGLLWRKRYQAAFAHMAPLLAVLAAPLLALARVRLVTWYTHRQRNWQVVWATRFSWRVVSAVESSFPIASAKLRPLGHGIPEDFYTPATQPSAADGPPLVALVARLTPIKQQDRLIEAIAPLDCRLALIGGIPDGYEGDYARQLRLQVADLGLQGRVIFAGEQTPAQVRDWYRRCALAVNLSPIGLFDKAALEAMSCGLPTLVTNPAFAPLMDAAAAQALILPERPEVEALRAALANCLARPAAERRALGLQLRQAVSAQHGLTRLAERLARLLATGEPDPPA